jgi:hypothetical protein
MPQVPTASAQALASELSLYFNFVSFGIKSQFQSIEMRTHLCLRYLDGASNPA